MWGFSDNSQAVLLDGSPSARQRVIYSVRRVPEQLVQFGTVKVDYGTVAVWRPFDPKNLSEAAPWQKEPWRNVYRIHVHQYPIPNRPKYVEFSLEEMEVGDTVATLPFATLEVTRALKEHLRAI